MLKENNGKNDLVLPFTREGLAQRLGVARETVIRQLHHLKDENLIDLKKPQRIIIRDKAGLEKLL